MGRMKPLARELLVAPGSKIRLGDVDPSDTHGLGKQEAGDHLAENLDRLSVLQYLLYAEAQQALLVVLQGIDAGGKDGTIRHVMSGLNPQGVKVTPFKVPEGAEKRHDYLWRVHQAVPEQGQIGIFNRSHYEDVLITRVHGLVSDKVAKQRFTQINEFEEMLHENGTTIVKLFLHISKDEQKKRLEERIHNRSVDNSGRAESRSSAQGKRGSDESAKREIRFQRDVLPEGRAQLRELRRIGDHADDRRQLGAHANHRCCA